MTVYNLGSVNIDMVVQVAHLPKPGETLAAFSSSTGLGGKGANQSVAVGRCGHPIRHIGAVGADGLEVRQALADAGVDIGFVAVGEAATGRAIVMVDEAGENSIILLPGANMAQREDHIRSALTKARAGDTLLLQNETTLQPVAAKLASAQGLRVIYSAAPFDVTAVRALLPFISVLLMNEIEAQQLCKALDTRLEDVSVPHIVVTQGAAGATLHDTAAGTKTAFPALSVTPVDTTGAGDTFAGVLAACLDQSHPWDVSMQVALGAASLSTTKPGAAVAIPTIAEVSRALQAQLGVTVPGLSD